jgi:hypothetical protein
MAISEHELAAMTGTLEEMHHESMNEVRDNMASLTDRLASVARSHASRRTFLLGGLAVAGAGALAACGSSSSGGKAAAGGATTTPSTSPYTGDLKVVALAAALENLAVAGYGLVLANAGKGVYGKVPAAIGNFATVAKMQHTQHAAAWNGVSALKAAKTIPDVATVALGLENAAAQTYVFAAANVTDPGGIATAASIAPVEAMHAAILSFVLGKYPVPNSDIGITGAVQPSALTA